MTPWRRPNNNFNNRIFATAKEIVNARERSRNHKRRFKIKFLLPQGKNLEVKHRSNLARRTRVRRKSNISC